MMDKSRKYLLVAVLLLVLGLLSGSLMAAPASEANDLVARLQAQGDGAVKVQVDHVTGLATYVERENGALTHEFAGQGASAEATARAFLGAYGAMFGLADQATDLTLQSVKTDELGMNHVRFNQVYGGLPVFGTDLIVHLDRDGAVLSVNGYTLPLMSRFSTQVAVSAEEAGKIAATQLAFTRDAAATESSLVIFNPGLITDQASETTVSYRVRVDSASQPELAQWVFVDANSGAVRFSYPAVADARNRRTYNMRRSTSYGSAVLARSETTPPVTSASNCTAADVNNAHNYAGNTYDFYYSRFGRDSYNNAGAALNSYVCYGNNYQNAFWDGSRMTYGAGFASADDVVAHELSHAVTQYASGLVYSYQSGALNESYSDIFGEAVDLTNGSGTDTSAVRWDMGENIPGIGAIRDMMDPTRFQDPDRTNSSYYYCGSGDSGGVHINSGVPNKAFALMVDGGSFNGYSVTSIGIDRAVQIQYRTNEYYLTSSSKFRDNYNALQTSCNYLYGSTSTYCVNAKRAADAVVMNGSICGAP